MVVIIRTQYVTLNYRRTAYRSWSSHYCKNDDVIKWKHFPRYWTFVRGSPRSPVNSPHKGQWRGALMFSLICVWINGWVNNRKAGDLRRYCTYYDVIVMNGKLNCFDLLEASGNWCLRCVVTWSSRVLQSFSIEIPHAYFDGDLSLLQYITGMSIEDLTESCMPI